MSSEPKTTTTGTVTPPPLPMAGEASTAAVPMAEVKADLVPYASASADERAIIDRLIAEIDLGNANSIIFFGSKAQGELTEISEQMIEGVRNKDTGPAGDALSRMLSTLRGFEADELDPKNKPSWFRRLLGAAEPLAKFVQEYEQVRGQIDTITNSLDRHKSTLMADIEKLDRLYASTLDYFRQLALYIAAGEEKLRQLDAETIPALAKAAESGDVLQAQSLRDVRAARDDLERRVHDLKLTRQVTMQALPSIRLIQENDKGLVNKIGSTIANTVPLWKTQLAQAITIYRSSEAAKTLKQATDLTNELLEANAKNLKEANAEIRTQLERGVFDIEIVERANNALIETIQDSLRIADEGKAKRAEAEARLIQAEQDLKKVLAAASARAAGAPPSATPRG
jgi:uncharacterized protein YaaN involved in tellurite resistance